MMEAVRTSETSVSIYQTTWRNIPEGSNLQSAVTLDENNPPLFTEVSFE
jgi:hypothetical protein